MVDNREIAQQECLDLLTNPCKGILLLSPRIGKTFIGISYIKKYKLKKILWVTPSVKLRDVDIPQEFITWKAKSYLPKTEIICYNSLSSVKGKYDLVILDEIQNVTEGNSVGFFNGDIEYTSILGLTGTMPKHEEKLQIIKNLDLSILKEITIDEAVESNMVADYKIKVVEVPLDHVTKNIVAGSKKKPFKTTEGANYQYLSKKIDNPKLPFNFELSFDKKFIVVEDTKFELHQFNPKFDADIAFILREPGKTFGSYGYIAQKDDQIYGKIVYNKIDYRIKEDGIYYIVTKNQLLNRMRFIQRSPSKLNVAKKLINHLPGRKLVFTGSIEHAEELSPYTYHSKTNDVDLNKFLNEEVDLLSCVNAGGTGFTYKNVDHFIITQADSNKSGGVIQKISRGLLLQNNYTASIWVLVLQGTQDEEWVRKALSELNQNKIEYINVKNLKL